MPKVFEENCKVNIIEYGENCHHGLCMQTLVSNTFSAFKSLLKTA